MRIKSVGIGFGFMLLLAAIATVWVWLRVIAFHRGPERLVLDDVKVEAADSQGAHEGYDTQIIIKAHEEGTIPTYPNLKYVGGSWSIADLRLVSAKHPEKSASLPTDKKLLRSILFLGGPTDSYFKIYLKLYSFPVTEGRIEFRAKIYADNAYNVYKGKKATGTAFFPSAATLVSITIRR